jgi:hypothetical protein
VIDLHGLNIGQETARALWGVSLWGIYPPENWCQPGCLMATLGNGSVCNFGGASACRAVAWRRLILASRLGSSPAPPKLSHYRGARPGLCGDSRYLNVPACTKRKPTRRATSG